ncbi:MAG: DUF2911 domain-containing protein [Opitutaceae bacterium]|nr:DUF2911 domain-containing protein [Opitutaceae bacterium]
MKPLPTPHAFRYALIASLVTASLLAQSPSSNKSAPKAKAADAPRISAPPASPPSTLKQRVGFTDIEITYARPGMKGRKIYGGLVAFGEVWRTGANTATKVTFSTPVKIEGQELPAGSYALYTIPAQKEWTIIFNKVTGEWGAYSYKQENDALRVKVKSVALAQPVETFTININDLRTETATLDLIWEKTRVPVKLHMDAIQNVVAQIDAAMASGQKLAPSAYFTAAMFYYEQGLDLNKARSWIEQATSGDKPLFYMLHGKAKILAKLGDKAGAIGAARQSIAGADGATKAEYTRLNEALIASLQ